MEVKSKPDFGAVSDLLVEYTTKVFSAASQKPIYSQNGVFVRWWMALFMVFLAMTPVALLILSEIGVLTGYSTPELIVAVGLAGLGVPTYFFQEYIRTRSKREKYSRYHLRALSVTLHRVVQYADEILEHMSMEPAQKLELGLRIAEAEGALRHASVILDEAIVEFESHDVPDIEFKEGR
jgi:hypothetical protein